MRVRYLDFGPFRVDAVKRLLLRDGRKVDLTPKAFDILVALLRRRGELLSKEQLFMAVWPGRVVEEGNLSRNVSTLRKALGESPAEHRFVVTRARRGYEFVGDVREVREASAPAQLPTIASLAVLPFANLSGDADQEYFADGLTDALITELAQIRALRVVSRTSTMRFKNTSTSLPEVARLLDADGVIEGSVMRDGRRVRITVQLIEGRSDHHLWARAYDGDLADVIGLLGTVTEAIVREIRVALTPTERARLSTVRVVDPAAHEAYLRGRYFWNLRTPEGLHRSVACFEDAIGKDADFAPAHVAIARAYAVMLDYGLQPPGSLAPKAIQAVRRALELDGELGEAHAARALLRLIHEWDFDGAEQEFRRTLDLCPGDATAHQWYGVLLMYQRRFDESLRRMREAQRLDPLSPIIGSALGLVLVLAGRHVEGTRLAESMLELDSRSPQAYTVRGLAHQLTGRHAQAIADFRSAADVSHEDAEAMARLGCAGAACGDRAAGRRILRDLRTRAASGYVSPGCFAVLELALGNVAGALEEIGIGVREHAPSILMLAVDPAFAVLQSDARTQKALRNMGVPPELLLPQVAAAPARPPQANTRARHP